MFADDMGTVLDQLRREIPRDGVVQRACIVEAIQETS
jgi:hypothetical protein